MIASLNSKALTVVISSTSPPISLKNNSSLAFLPPKKIPSNPSMKPSKKSKMEPSVSAKAAQNPSKKNDSKPSLMPIFVSNVKKRNPLENLLPNLKTSNPHNHQKIPQPINVWFNSLDCLAQIKNSLILENRFQVTASKPLKTIQPITKKSSQIQSLKDQVQKCTLCSLSQTRKNPVFGTGNIHASVMIVGEAPGYQEDQDALPFVGKSGKLLDKMLASINISRKDVFIANLIKCRPPNNRKPSKNEIDQCSSFLLNQIQLIQPKIIFSLGNFASQFLLKLNVGITKLRGKTYPFGNSIVLPSFHPSALLQNPKLKIQAWKDLKLLKKILANFQKTHKIKT